MGNVRDKLDQIVIAANNETESLGKGTKKAMIGVSGALAMAPVLVNSFALITTPSNIFANVATMLNNIYGQIVGITSVTAGCMAAICLFMMFFSKNGRTVEESVSWLKRIVICWIAIMAMSSIIKFLSNGLGVDKATDLTNL